jgi:hypothetical protein
MDNAKKTSFSIDLAFGKASGKAPTEVGADFLSCRGPAALMTGAAHAISSHLFARCPGFIGSRTGYAVFDQQPCERRAIVVVPGNAHVSQSVFPFHG